MFKKLFIIMVLVNLVSCYGIDLPNDNNPEDEQDVFQGMTFDQFTIYFYSEENHLDFMNVIVNMNNLISANWVNGISQMADRINDYYFGCNFLPHHLTASQIRIYVENVLFAGLDFSYKSLAFGRQISFGVEVR